MFSLLMESFLGKIYLVSSFNLNASRKVMNSFIKYNEKLRDLYSSCINDRESFSFSKINLENDPHEFLRMNEKIDSLRGLGIFFTGEQLSNECAAYMAKTLTSSSKVIDPCCGAGNLLVSLSKYFPVCTTLTKTLKLWNEKLYGYDLIQDFVEAAKIRLIFQALERGVKVDQPDLNINLELLNNIQCIDGLNVDINSINFTHVIINPPYNQSLLDDYKYWKGGKVNLAAVFIDKYVSRAKSGTHIVAILPDVLRSGTRYDIWRKSMGKYLEGDILLKGRFDKKTDVDIFILNANVVEGNGCLKWTTEENTDHVVSKYFSVSIGRIVPHRDPMEGELHAYIYPGLLKSWVEVDSNDINSERRHKSVPIYPPFITIKRTSSPKDKDRAGAHLILGDKPTYVENHLIVVKPYDNTIDKCHKLIEHLKSAKVNDYLNNIIRCRHLTVKAVKNIPLNDEDYNEEIN
ncbi:TPA: SAM-dependent DNA methyltransferase [Klebsiella pneumoniae subsp. pneumoniae]|nr:SAM-dependent methyltransferase [Klebsiella variicola]HBY0307533.1 SAM-dependent DNA methyltransferase [Klebsiella pneumoniae subsp. pneumoniae]